VIGESLGPYTVVSRLGAGGMGEVYRARDGRLGRQVALKVLPDAYAHDPERLARFRREAQVLAALNHSNIAQIYGFEESSDRHALVLELVEGSTLAEAIAAVRPNGLGLRRALEIARQVVDALDAAHAHGIVHRDLKPANIKLQSSPDDQSVTVKVLDFGLAKALSLEDHVVTSDMAHSPTITSPMTAPGVILGTAGYMAPEQAMGAVADRRADIWAFGVLLYEMLAGRRPFDGADVGTLLTESATSDVDVSALPAETPASVRRLIRRCLEKNPRRRLRDIGDARAELDDSETTSGFTGAPGTRAAAATPRYAAWIPWGLAAALGVAVLFLALRPDPAAPVPGPPVRFLLNGPDGKPYFGHHALSPDGRHVAFTATSNRRSVWIRSLDTLDLREVPNTANARDLFWSPDSRSIGYFVDGEIKTVNIVSALATVACKAPAGGNGAWGRDDVIIHGGTSGIVACGRESPVTRITAGEIGHVSPFFLPDGRHFVYLAVTSTSGELRVASIDDGVRRAVIGPSDSGAVYSEGHLLFVRSGILLARPFDAMTLTTRGEPFRVTEDPIPVRLLTRRTPISSSSVGTISFAARASTESMLTWFDRKGVPLGTVGAAAYNFNLGLSPDGQLLAVSRQSRTTTHFGSDIWILDLARGGHAVRLTDDPGSEFDPVWSPDGRSILFNSNRAGPLALYRRAADGSGADELVVSREVSLTTPDWSPVEDVLLYSADAEAGKGDIEKLPLGPGATASDFLATPFSEREPAFSPDGRWVAYTTNMSGRDEVYIRAFAGDPRQIPVSLDGGTAARWRGDGREIFFLAPDRSMMAARLDTRAGMRIGTPLRLFGTEVSPTDGHPYVVSKDGQRFLMGVPREAAPDSGVSILTNWLAAVRR
jgi:Tol biopolymer transport system component